MDMPTRIVIASNVFQSQLAELLMYLTFVLVYINVLASGGYRIFEEHLNGVTIVLASLEEPGIQGNLSKCYCARGEINCIGLILCKDRVKPQPK